MEILVICPQQHWAHTFQDSSAASQPVRSHTRKTCNSVSPAAGEYSHSCWRRGCWRSSHFHSFSLSPSGILTVLWGLEIFNGWGYAVWVTAVVECAMPGG